VQPRPFIVRIDALSDPRLDHYRDVRERDLRGREQCFLAESASVVRRLLRRPDRIISLLLTQHRFASIEEEVMACGVSFPVLIADLDLMTAIAGFHIHRGVMAACRRPSAVDLSMSAAFRVLRDPGPRMVLVLEGITNVDNMGAIFRNAAAFGADGILLDPSCCDPLYRKAVRVSMGHVLSVPWAVAGDWPEDLDRLVEMLGVRLVAAETGAGALPVKGLPRTPRTAILLGSEAHGLSEGARMRCDVTAFVPMADGVPSLNVAVASAIFLHELSDVHHREKIRV